MHRRSVQSLWPRNSPDLFDDDATVLYSEGASLPRPIVQAMLQRNALSHCCAGTAARTPVHGSRHHELRRKHFDNFLQRNRRSAKLTIPTGNTIWRSRCVTERMHHQHQLSVVLWILPSIQLGDLDLQLERFEAKQSSLRPQWNE